LSHQKQREKPIAAGFGAQKKRSGRTPFLEILESLKASF
jgi:hypothetical protein